MNIKQAKEYIKNSVVLYLKKDEFGEYRVPVVRQRPIFLLGAPGIGKTAIMEQIAGELGVALVSYSMTHHTRQSALGLPFITRKNYGGKEYSVSEYTMSEIIASIYDTMEQSGMKEGILFLDEINCVSETLAPSMLQFLQYKVFGRHKVPEGWVIVTAGNPPEYNKSVREFDVVTMDRLKVLSVEADYNIWREYAVNRGVHSAVLNYLDLKKDHFYVMEMTTAGRSYVTARGWEDLSEMIKLYEDEQVQVEESLVEQYLHNDKVVREFTAYYDMYNRYKKDYRVEDILEGAPSVQAIARASAAPFDERLSLLGMLIDKITADMKEVMEEAAVLTGLKPLLQILQQKSQDTTMDRMIEQVKNLAEGQKKAMQNLQLANTLSDEERRKRRRTIGFLEETAKELLNLETDRAGGAGEGEIAFLYIRKKYLARVKLLKENTGRVQGRLHCLFTFAAEAFAKGNEMLILVTQLTVGQYSAKFISTFGSEDYNRYSEELMLSERSADLNRETEALNLDM